MLISHLLSASSPFLSGASTPGLVSVMPVDQGGGSKSRCTEQLRGRLPVGDQGMMIGFTPFDVFQSEPWLLFSHSCTPQPHPTTSYTIGDSEEKAVGLSGRILHSWRNWVLTHTSTLTLVGKTQIEMLSSGSGQSHFGKEVTQVTCNSFAYLLQCIHFGSICPSDVPERFCLSPGLPA